MSDKTQVWLEYAQADLDAADRLLNSPNPNSWTFLLAAWHCHQAIEKALKMVIISQDKENLKVHDLLRLAELAELNMSDEQLNFLEDVNRYYSRSRYPDIIYKPFPSLDGTTSQTIFDSTKQLFLWLKQQTN